MDNLPNIPTGSSPVALQNSQSLWSRPLWGEGSIIGDLLTGGKPAIPQEAIVLHNREKMDAHFFAKTAEGIDSEKFNKPDFLMLIKIRYYLVSGIGEYAGLNESAKLLQAAIEASNSYLKLDQTELRYRSSKQQEFYEFVVKLLKNHEEKEAFRSQIQEKLKELLPSIKTEEGKIALETYVLELKKLSEYELGLKLLSLFKAYQLGDYSILRTIADMVAILRENEKSDFKSLVTLVSQKFEIFEKIRKIIGVSEERSNPETYALMLQYIALNYKYKIAYNKFSDLVSVLQKWHKPYQALLQIRQEHPSEQYRQPKEFQEAIPGEAIYEKYKKLLTDPKTGQVYVDLGAPNS